jgi:hypothetical protein
MVDCAVLHYRQDKALPGHLLVILESELTGSNMAAAAKPFDENEVSARWIDARGAQVVA